MKTFDYLKTFSLTAIVIIASQLIPITPWWFFLIPVFLVGIGITIKQYRVSAFPVGFVAGFSVWLGCNLYFHWLYHGVYFNAEKRWLLILFLALSGLIGGLLTGLALYAGTIFLKRYKNDYNNLPIENNPNKPM